MSVSRPAQCVFCLFKRSTRLQGSSLSRRSFQSTASTRKRTKDDDRDALIRKSHNANWEDHYTPEQLEAIKAAEKLIPRDKFKDGLGARRSDPWAPKDYLDTLSEIDPVVDKAPKTSLENLDDNLRLKNSDELREEIQRAAKKLQAEFKLGQTPDVSDDDADEKFFEAFDKEVLLANGKEEAVRNPPGATAPSVPSPRTEPTEEKNPQRHKKKNEDKNQRDADEELSPALVRLMQMTGYDRPRIARLKVKTLVQKRVTNQTRLGKISRTYCLTVAGNGMGLVGLGEGKAEEGLEAKLQSQYRAIRNMQPILRYENRTIYGDVNGKVGATELELYTRPPGFGLRCQQYIWEIAKCAGISDLAARVPRARNPMNTVKATFQALMKQKDPEDIARARGKKMVDVRKVYYAGQV